MSKGDIGLTLLTLNIVTRNRTNIVVTNFNSKNGKIIKIFIIFIPQSQIYIAKWKISYQIFKYSNLPAFVSRVSFDRLYRYYSFLYYDYYYYDYDYCCYYYYYCDY